MSRYPVQAEVRAPFVEADWDLAAMEPKTGIYPGQESPNPAPPSVRHAKIRN